MLKKMGIDEKYSNIAKWIQEGTIEIGFEWRYKGMIARALDEGGPVWEGKFKTLEEALESLDKGIALWCEENGV
jgi:hypothetical protein